MKVDIYRLLVLVQKAVMTNHLGAVTFINNDLHALFSVLTSRLTSLWLYN